MNIAKASILNPEESDNAAVRLALICRPHEVALRPVKASKYNGVIWPVASLGRGGDTAVVLLRRVV